MAVANFLIAMLPALLAAAAVFDLFTYTIPNSVTGSIFLLFVMLSAVMTLLGQPIAAGVMGLHLLAGFVSLIAGVALFAAGFAGGGDAKLLAVCALWLGWPLVLDYLFLSAVLGGALSVVLLTLRAFALPPRLAAVPFVARLTDRKQGVPYGIALAGAAFLLWPHSDLMHQAAAI